MSRFYVLLDGEVTQAKAEESIRAHMAPYCVEFERTEWFSTFDGRKCKLHRTVRLLTLLIRSSRAGRRNFRI
jgi:hypothetical protein